MIVQSSDVCEALAAALRAWIESAPSAWLCLYTNDLPLDPDKENPGAYIEATYAGYARFATLGTWSAPVRDGTGLYHISSGPWTFAVNTGAVGQVVYGWFLLRDTRVVLMERFAGAPLTIQVGAPGPTLLVQPSQAAQTVACPGS